MSLKTEEKDRRSRLYLFIIVLLLFLANAWLIYSLMSKEKELTQTEEQRDILSEEKERLENMLDDAEVQLTTYRGKNQELDSIIDERDKIIANKVSQIRSLLKSGNLSRAELEAAQREVEKLNGQIRGFKQEIDSLKTQNRFLEDEVYMKDNEIKEKDDRIDRLESDYTEAMNRVKIGARLKAIDLEASAIRLRSGDKERQVSRLSRTDKIKVVFTIDHNDVAEIGNKMVYLKVITPSKSTLHNEGKGSGKFVYQGEESLFTAKQEFEFKNQREKMTFYWDKSPGMISGDYEAYLFCEDNIIGKTDFSLK